MESPLEVLSRAATMVQDNASESRLSSKELPTAKWRRDRRIRLSAEYHSSAPQSAPPRPLNEQSSNTGNVTQLQAAGNAGSADLPLDMSGKPPPPPYREPLPGSQFAHHLARPSVITQAPKRDLAAAAETSPQCRSPGAKRTGPANQENHTTMFRAVAAVSPSSAVAAVATVSPTTASTATNESISMIDPVIDEHFRRSLGADYAALFGNNKKPGAAIKPTPIASLRKPLHHQSTPPTQTSPTAANANASASSSSTSTNGISTAIHHHHHHHHLSSASSASNTTSNSSSSHSATANLPLLSAIVTPTVRANPSGGSAAASSRRSVDPQLSPQLAPAAVNMVVVDDAVGMSVDDHFAKALGGDTWKQLQRSESGRSEATEAAADHQQQPTATHPTAAVVKQEVTK